MGLPLVELWIAKKVTMFLAARAYGFKPLYRRCLETNDKFFTKGGQTHRGIKWTVRHTFDATLKFAN